MITKFKDNKNSKMEIGEELLGQSYAVHQGTHKDSILVGIDCGSTQTRCVILKPEDDVEQLDTLYVIPSQFSGISTFGEVLPQSDKLYGNMDSWITCSSSEPDGLFDKIRVMRGTKRADANASREGINSSKQKIHTPALYINAIDGIAYGLIMKGGELAAEYDVYLGTSLPPDNVSSKPNRELFFRRMKRTFEFENKDLGVHFRLNIKDVFLQTESEAELRGYKVKYSEENEESDSNDKVALIVEVGGSTVGTAIIDENGISVRSAARTFSYGGTQLQDMLGTILEDKIGTITTKQRKVALETGLVKQSGRGVTEVVDLVKEAKDQFASRIYSSLYSEVFDQLGNSDLDMVDISEVYFSGRTCDEGDYDEDSHEGYSIVEPLTSKLRNDLPDATFIHMPVNLIPFGNAIKAYEEFEDAFLAEEISDLVESIDKIEGTINDLTEEVVNDLEEE